MCNLQSDCRHLEISHPLICFTILSPKIITNFCFGIAFFSVTYLFSDFRFILSVLLDRSVSISLDFSIVKLTLDVFITDVWKSVLLVVSVLCESFCFTGVAFSSIIFRTRFLPCGWITGVCITSCGWITGVCITSVFWEFAICLCFYVGPLEMIFALLGDL